MHRYILIGGLFGKRPDPGYVPISANNAYMLILLRESFEGMTFIHRYFQMSCKIPLYTKRIVLTDAKGPAIDIFG